MVQQSNNLYNQHQQQQQLFKPDPNFLNAYNSPSQFGEQIQGGGIQTVASPGQIYSQFQDQFNSDQYQTINESDQFGIGALTTAKQQYQTINNQEQFTNTPQVEQFSNNQIDPYQAQGSQTVGSFSNFIDPTPQKPYHLQQQQYANRQQENEQILAKANQELYENQILNQQQQQHSTNSPTTDASSAHNQHQQLLAQQFGASGLQPMRIVLPDDDQFPESSNNYQFRQRADEDTSVYENASSEDSLSTIIDEIDQTETGDNDDLPTTKIVEDKTNSSMERVSNKQ